MDASYPLRALGIGEIFDRAITIYIRHFAPLTLIVMTLTVPIAILQGLVAPDRVGFARAIQDMSHPGSATPFNTPEFVAIMLISMVALMLFPVVYSAVAVGVADIYNNKAPSYARSMSRALRRFWPLMGVTLLYGGIIGGVYVGFVIVIMLLAFLTAALMSVSTVLGVIGWIFVGIVALALVAALLLLVLGLAFSTYATVIELKGVIVALTSSFSRLYTRKEMAKALLMVLAYCGLNLGILLLTGALSFGADSLLHNNIVDLVIQAIVSACSGAMLTVLLAVYYYDVRTRSEGLDLEVELARLTSAA